MAEPLALRYRPTTFDDLVGQKPVAVMLRAMVARDRVPTVSLLHGPAGTGKTTTARLLAAALNCESPPAPCGVCASDKAVYDATSADVVELDASVASVADLQGQRGSGGRYRVLVLDQAHQLGADAWGPLSRLLEEPPPGVVFLLCSTDPAALPATVLDRATPFAFRRVATADITERLRHICAAEGADVAEDLLSLLAERADGSVRDAVTALDQVLGAAVSTTAEYTALHGEVDYAPRLAAALHAGDLAAAYAQVEAACAGVGDPGAVADALARLYTDLLILHGGGVPNQQGRRGTERVELAGRMDAATIVAAMTVLWDHRTRIEPGVDPRVGLELAIAMIAQAHRRGRPAPPPTPPPAPARLSLSQLAAIRPQGVPA